MRKTRVWQIQHDFGYDDLHESSWLYNEWIFPNKYSDAVNREVLDAGSGPGLQVQLFAKYATSVTAVDLEAIEVSRRKAREFDNVIFVEDDISTMNLGKQFSVVNCVGVIHHTDNPSITFENLFKHLEIGGRFILWAYAKEGNFLMARVVEPLRKTLLQKQPHWVIRACSIMLTGILYLLVHTVYKLPLKSMPYFQYFKNFRKLTFSRNALNVYDKLNAPQQYFIPRSTIEKWFDSRFTDVHIDHYLNCSWRVSGTKVSD